MIDLGKGLLQTAQCDELICDTSFAGADSRISDGLLDDLLGLDDGSLSLLCGLLRCRCSLLRCFFRHYKMLYSAIIGLESNSL